MNKPIFIDAGDELDRRIYEILSKDTVEDLSTENYLIGRMAVVRRAVEGLLAKGEMLDDSLIRSVIRDTAPGAMWKKRYNPAEHGGRSYAQQARAMQRAKDEGSTEEE